MASSPVKDRLVSAREHLTRAARSAALEQLLAAWRQLRSPGIADLIDEVSLGMDFGPPLVDDLDDEDGHRAWLEVAGRDRPDDLWRLLLSVGHDIYHIDRSMERLTALAERDDPRLACALADMLCNQSDSLRITLHAYRPEDDPAGARAAFALETIARIGDRRASAALREVPAHTRPGLQRACRELAERIEAQRPAALDDNLQALCGEISTLLRAQDEGDRLWDQIAAEPDDDDRRLVYADWLCEHGDQARGEFISLQILEANARANEQQRRLADELLERHRDRWIGPFAHLDVDVRFERGLPISAGFGWARSWFHHHLIGHRLWSTVRHVSGAGFYRTADSVYVDALNHPRMKNVRSLETTPQIAAALAAEQPRPWTSLELFVSTAGGTALPQPGTVERLPLLTHLGIAGCYAAVIQGAEARCASVLAERELRLTVCRTDDGFDSLESVATFFAIARTCRFVEVRFTVDGWEEVTFSRDEAGTLSIVRGAAEALVGAGLEALPARSLTQIVVEGASDDADLAVLKTVADTHGCPLTVGEASLPPD